MILEVEIDFSEAEHTPSARWGSLKIGGVDVFTELVHDTNSEGERTEEQARKNLLLLFAHRLKDVLEDR